MKVFFSFFLAVVVGLQLPSFASDQDSKEPSHEGHSDTEKHGDSDHKHGEEEEEGGSVGPEKGIIEASERTGFKLSPEALKNFELKFKKLSGDGPWALPQNAVVHSGEERNLYRLRAGFFKRIDFETNRKSNAEIFVDSDDMREGDEIVVDGLGFLRIAELAAFGGVAHGHSH